MEDKDTKSVNTLNPLNRTWYTIENVADFFQTSPKTVRKWIYEKKLNYFKIGGLVRIHKKDMESFPIPMQKITEIFYENLRHKKE
jgi:excisionase family DNA binding protein